MLFESSRSYRVRLYGELVDLVSFLVIVPSGFSVTVLDFVLTVPSLLTLVSSVLEIVCAHPAVRKDSPKADMAAKVISLRGSMCFMKINYAKPCGRHWGITLPEALNRADGHF